MNVKCSAASILVYRAGSWYRPQTLLSSYICATKVSSQWRWCERIMWTSNNLWCVLLNLTDSHWICVTQLCQTLALSAQEMFTLDSDACSLTKWMWMNHTTSQWQAGLFLPIRVLIENQAITTSKLKYRTKWWELQSKVVGLIYIYIYNSKKKLDICRDI